MKNQQNSFFDAAFMVGDLLEKGSPYRLFRDKVMPALREARTTLAALYCADNGRPAIEPVVMAGATLLQFMEKAPDRKAAQHIKLHMGWKHALDLRLDDPGFDASSLCNFRRRLEEAGEERLVLDSLVKALQKAGLVKKRSKQRIDSTSVLACVSQMSRLEVVRETVRLFLEDLQKQDAAVRPEGWQSLVERYCESEVDYRHLSEEGKMVAKLRQAGQDMLLLSRWLEGQQELRERKAARLLKRVLGEQFEVVEQEVEVRKTEVAGGVKNPHDPEAQWAAKDPEGKTQHVGYKAQVVETVAEDGRAREKGEPTAQFITEVTTTEAVASDQDGMRRALQAQSEKGLEPPSELFADAAYVTGEELTKAEAEGRELTGPARRSPTQGMFPTERFDVDVANRKAVCPDGKASTACSLIHDKGRDHRYYRFKWGRQCEGCPLQSQCTGKRKRRTLIVGIYHEALQKRRRDMQSESFKERMRQRNAVEGTISELVRGYGMRRTRYRGLAKTRLANNFIGAACNVNRWARLASWQLAQAA